MPILELGSSCYLESIVVHPGIIGAFLAISAYSMSDSRMSHDGSGLKRGVSDGEPLLLFLVDTLAMKSQLRLMVCLTLRLSFRVSAVPGTVEDAGLQDCHVALRKVSFACQSSRTLPMIFHDIP